MKYEKKKEKNVVFSFQIRNLMELRNFGHAVITFIEIDSYQVPVKVNQ